MAFTCPNTWSAFRRLEIRLPVSGLERGPACHPERSEESLRPASQILRCAQDDRHSLQMSNQPFLTLTNALLQFKVDDSTGKERGEEPEDRKDSSWKMYHTS